MILAAVRTVLLKYPPKNFTLGAGHFIAWAAEDATKNHVHEVFIDTVSQVWKNILSYISTYVIYVGTWLYYRSYNHIASAIDTQSLSVVEFTEHSIGFVYSSNFCLSNTLDYSTWWLVVIIHVKYFHRDVLQTLDSFNLCML